MNILITGGTGFIGTYFRTELLKEGHFLRLISRQPGNYQDIDAKNQQFVGWKSNLNHHAEWADAVVNLAGENIFGQWWTEKVKKKIYNSRIQSTQALVKAIEEVDDRPDVMVSGSAVGYYGDTEGQLTDEEQQSGGDFLARVCRDWEREARKVPDDVRLVIPRLGIVLEKGGGALQQMLLPFKLFVGGPIGGGDQYFPWVHMHDVCEGLKFMLYDDHLEGPYNLNAPNPVTMRRFAEEIGAQLNRPSWFNVPRSLLHMVLGEAAQPITASLKVSSVKIQQAGFDFTFEYLEDALADILNR